MKRSRSSSVSGSTRRNWSVPSEKITVCVFPRAQAPALAGEVGAADFFERFCIAFDGGVVLPCQHPDVVADAGQTFAEEFWIEVFADDFLPIDGGAIDT